MKSLYNDPNDMRKSMLITGVTVAAIIVAAFISQMMFGRTRAVKLSITFLGFTTNSANSTRIAMFAVTNHSSSAITQIAPFVMLKKPQEVRSVLGGSFGFHIQPANSISNTNVWTTSPGKGFPPSNVELPAGGSEVLGFIAPTNEPLWQVDYRYFPDAGFALQLKRLTVSTLWRLRLRPAYTTTPSAISSAWVQDQPQLKSSEERQSPH